ncbi:hypothetical protein BJ878DRAFT_388418, partial [Calycina marina]
LDILSISLTFQCAPKAAYRLGARYIWIDALCIVQDSSEDWEREASNMRSIYKLAWDNIAVASSEKANGRLLMDRIPRLSRPCKLPDSVLSGYSTEERSYIIANTTFAYLSSRYYAKSERNLSPRIVDWSQEELIWELRSLTPSETTPWG